MTGEVPITVIAGYLGAGKTTLINRLLARLNSPGSARPSASGLGVLVNDYGTVNIDESLIAEQSGDGRVVGLSSGCVCCSIQDDLAGALDRLLDFDLERVLLEASGVGVPARLADVGDTWPGYRHRGVAVVVNSDDYLVKRGDRFVGQLVRQQVRQADLLAVRGERRLPDADVDGLEMLCLDSSELLDRLLQNSPFLVNADSQNQPAQTVSFAQRSWTGTEPVPRQGLADWLETLVGEVHRAKGRLFDAAGGYQVHLAGQQVTVSPDPAVTGCSLVLISPDAVPELPAEMPLQPCAG